MLTTKEKIVLDNLISLYSTDNTTYVERSDNIADISGNELSLIFKSLQQKGYIELKKYVDGSNSISLTYSGLSYKEQEKTTPPASASIINNFNAPVSNSAIATTGDVTIKLNNSFDEMRSEINSHNMESSDKEVALKLIDYIETLTENDAPLKKGFLSKFSDVVAKHSWLLTLIGNAFVKYFIG